MRSASRASGRLGSPAWPLPLRTRFTTPRGGGFAHCRSPSTSCCDSARLTCLLQQLVERDREVTDANARRLINRVGDSRRGADDTELADALRAERVRVRIVLVETVDFYPS